MYKKDTPCKLEKKLANFNHFRTKDIIAVLHAIQAAVKIKPEQKKKRLGFNGTYDHCDTNAVLYQLTKSSTENLFILFADCIRISSEHNDFAFQLYL